jgi:SPP1 gp7 family putative phage head morphogenesis protein
MNSKNRFIPPRRIEVTYRHAIARLATRYLQTPDESIFQELAAAIAGRMVAQVSVSNARSWREAAAKASRGREIYLALKREMQTGIGHRVQELVTENARLISSIPAKVREHVNDEIAEMERDGLRPETIQEHIRKRIPQLTVNQAALIARTETSKAATALTRARSEDLGIGWYQWLSAEDSRVRPSHRLMDKVLCAWNDPPAPEILNHESSTLGHYPAGGAPNCRCDCQPIVSLDQISWPARIYSAGSIRRMTRAQFAAFSGIQRRAA